MTIPVSQVDILTAILAGIEGNPGRGGCGVNFAIGDYEFEFVIDKTGGNEARGTVYLDDWDRPGSTDEIMQVVLSARVVSTTERAVYSDDRKADAAYHPDAPLDPGPSFADQWADQARADGAL